MKSFEDLFKDKQNSNKKTKPSIEKTINQAIQSHLKGNIREATKYYQELITEGCSDQRVFSNYGAILYGMGKLKDAAKFFRKAIAINSDFADAHSNLGNILRDQGDLQNAEVSVRKAIAINSDFADAHSNLGNILKDLGKLQEAEVSVRKAIALNPNFAVAHSNLGNILKDLGKLQEAEFSYREAIEIEPDFAGAYSNLGSILSDLGDLHEAEVSVGKAIALNPNLVEAHSNLGNILKDLGDLQKAELSYRKAIEIDPDFAIAHSNLGNILKDLGDLQKAELSYRKAIEISPYSAEAHSNLGNILRDLGDLQKAEISTRKAIKINPYYAEAHSNLGNILSDLDKFEEAELSYRKAIEIKPDYPTAYVNLGGIYKILGNFDQALATYKRGYAISPRSSILCTAANLFFQDVYEDTRHILKARTNYTNGIRIIERNLPKLDIPVKEMSTDMFWLAYQNINNDKEILVKLGKTMQDLYRISETNLKLSHTSRESKNDEMNIGICSDFLSSHTIGLLYKGIILAFKNSEINITIIRGPAAKNDSLSREIDSYTGKSIRLPSSINDAVEIIKKETFDALFYPDIGMSPYTYLLALYRLSPIQVTSWGHPNTTGLNTIDYFISSELIEPKNAQALYKEQLIKLRKLPCMYAKPKLEIRGKFRDKFQMPSDKTLIGIPQSLFKFHPDYDNVLERIIDKLPDTNFVIIEGGYKSQTQRLKKRWSATAPKTLKKTIFLKKMPQEDYLCLLDTVDILLDPIYFGSGNTFYEAMAVGTPLVTMPGNYMRGRAVAAGYKQMKLKNAPVARNIQEYIDLTIKLAKNPEIRMQIKEGIKTAALQYLFDDQEAANEIIEFFKAAIEERRNTGGLLPLGWKPLLKVEG